jgi:hypothetical protein
LLNVWLPAPSSWLRFIPIIIINFGFAECRKLESLGESVSCDEGETAMKCLATGPCGASQIYNGRGCKINSCGFGGKLKAICCKETGDNWGIAVGR